MTDRPLTVDEVADVVRVSSRTVMRAIAAGHLEASRLTQGRGGWRVRPDAIDGWLETRSNQRIATRSIGDVGRAAAEPVAPRRHVPSMRARGSGTLVA